MILALDIATATGWARSDGASGTLRLPVAGDWREAGAALGDWLADQFATQPIDLLVWERPFHRGKASYLLNGLAYHASVIAFIYGIECRDVSPTEIKKWATGSGRADKAAMARAAARLGWAPDTYDEADAICLLSMIMEGET